MTCTVENCDRQVHARRLCSMHYQRWQTHGDPLVTVYERIENPPALCTVEDCENPYYARGCCKSHHHRLLAYGDPTAGRPMQPRGAIFERLMAKVDKNGPIPGRWPHLGPCWVWTGSTFKNYGRIGIDGRGHTAATHRVAYEQLVGPIPEGTELDHLCVNPPCCNPAHLEPVTHVENIRRAIARTKGESLCRS